MFGVTGCVTSTEGASHQLGFETPLADLRLRERDSPVRDVLSRVDRVSLARGFGFREHFRIWDALAFNCGAAALGLPAMSILIFALIVLIVAALVARAVQKLPLPSPFGTIIQALILIIAAVVIAQRAGLF